MKTTHSWNADPAAAMGAVRGVVLGLFMLGGLQGCLGSELVEQLTFDRSAREGTVKVWEDDRFVIHAHPQTLQRKDAPTEASYLHAGLAHHAKLLGGLPRRKILVYIHPPDPFDDFYTGNYDGFAWCGDLSMDVIWKEQYWMASGMPGWIKLQFHELAHLAMCDLWGESKRPFLIEGMAEYLALIAYRSFRDEKPASVAKFFLRECETWQLRPMFAGCSWWSGKQDYEVAALFTEVDVQRMGLSRYIQEYYWPAGFGTTNEAESLLVKVMGLSFSKMEQVMRQASFEANPGRRPCSTSAARCTGICSCRQSPRAGGDTVCVPRGVEP